MSLPNPHNFTNKLLQKTKQEDRETLVMQYAKQVPKKYMPNYKVQRFTRLSTIYEKDLHALIEGMTGAGKTTLLLSILREFLRRGNIVLHRDDGGLEFMYIACYYDTRIFIPNFPEVKLDIEGFKADIVKFDHPKEIIEQVWRYDYPFNVIVYDVFCDTVKQKASFYSNFFMSLIGTLQRMRKSHKRNVVLSVDELNDLIPPRGKGSSALSVTKGDIEMNIRKVRKHFLKIISSSHRFNQIGVDTRSQMGQIYFKKSYGYDVWDFLSKNLVTSNSKTFWGMVRRLLTLPINQFLLFNEERKFDLYTFKDIPRPESIDIEAIGSIPIKGKQDKAEQKNMQRLVAVFDWIKKTELFAKDSRGYYYPVTIKGLSKIAKMDRTVIPHARQQVKELKKDFELPTIERGKRRI